ncbi:hypothetical protein F5Y05DRAFT_369401 [Hypoxylon sp. FL0543]|nr:hypothetical protein F5Y05DRAFT_369401 [Hypoxylon sp. FL0543]
MASLGKFTNSFISGVNENTLALANLNFDFSIIKLEAPKEYTALGKALGGARKENAEYGATHRTARKLGALFEALIPPIPRIVAAYGKRSSQIIQAPGANPSGNVESHGAFADFVGADATSIWAAATSGGTAIGIHLLACMLARAFTDPAQATSVWAELVSNRQREIMQEAQNPMLNLAHIAAVNAANQQISRDDLRRWDASARAWLQTADGAMHKECIQLKLILKNISLPVTAGANLYRDVIRAWKQAMVGLECLLKGEPQSVTDGAILLAISAWHIFPNLIVLGRETKNIHFGDSVMPPEGVLTIGITTDREGDDLNSGIYWSVALSHYRYYGKPMQATGKADTRLTMDELHLVALGSLLRTWSAPRAQFELSARWFVALWECVGRVKDSLRPPQWLEIVANAAARFIGATGTVKKEFSSLIDFGYRRGRNFLVRSSLHSSWVPWFGLRCRHILESLRSEDAETCAVEYMRQLASFGGLEPDQALITYISQGGETIKKVQVHTYYTAAVRPNLKTDEATSSPSLSNAPGLKDDDLDPKAQEDPKTRDSVSNFTKTAVSPSPKEPDCFSRLSSCFHRSWSNAWPMEQDRATWDVAGLNHITDPLITPNLILGKGGLAKRHLTLPLQLNCYHFSRNTNSVLYDCHAVLANHLGWFSVDRPQFSKCFTDPSDTVRLYITEFKDGDQEVFETAITRIRSAKSFPLVSLDESISILTSSGNQPDSKKLDPLLLWQYLEGPDPSDPRSSMNPALGLMENERRQIQSISRALSSLAFAQQIYKHLDGATVSSTIVERGIYDAKWGMKLNQAHQFTKSTVFSCIAMMETGQVNLDGSRLNDVFALSYGNSLFVSSRLLSDPYANTPDHAVTRIVGNVGRPGLSLLVPPTTEALVRPLSSSYRAVNYEPFDGNREDNFKGTTLHLSFTSHEFPLDYGATGIIDHQVFLVESVISVHDAGQWVGDLDILKVFGERNHRLPTSRPRRRGVCQHDDIVKQAVLDDLSTIDTWEEVLDTPPSIGVIRAHKNWPGRLAASVIPTQKLADDDITFDETNHPENNIPSLHSPRAIVLENGTDTCWVCVYRRVQKMLPKNPQSQVFLVA